MPRLVEPVVPAGRMKSMDQPVLRASDDVVLRPWEEADAPGLMTAFGDPLIQRWHMRRMDSPDEAVDWIETWHDRWHSEAAASWAVSRPAGELCGYVALHGLNLEGGTAQVSYWVIPAARGQGVATSTASEVCRWAFVELGLRRLWLMHSIKNAPSCRVANKAGFVVEGMQRDGLLHLDGWHDMHVHARLADDV
jgi:ribosomal-protein-alanine N-acetyltransferase